MKAQAAEFAQGLDGRVFALRVVNPGDAYGVLGRLINDGVQPIIEFYDTTYAGEIDNEFSGHLGQFVAHYYFSTLMDTDPTQNLALCESVPVWTVTADSLAQALASPALHANIPTV
jgi:hypothetical protein